MSTPSLESSSEESSHSCCHDESFSSLESDIVEWVDDSAAKMEPCLEVETFLPRTRPPHQEKPVSASDYNDDESFDSDLVAWVQDYSVKMEHFLDVETYLSTCNDDDDQSSSSSSRATENSIEDDDDWLSAHAFINNE